jgi:hypothetical protein
MGFFVRMHRGLVEKGPVVVRPEQLQPLAVGPQDAARLVGVSDTHFEKYVAPHIGCVRIGARKLFRVAALDKWLRDREQSGTGGAGCSCLIF